MPEKRGKMRKISNSGNRDDSDLVLSQEKKQRKKWTTEETQMLVDGCNVVSILNHFTRVVLTLLLQHGVGNWKAILSDPNLKFDNRSPVDLKDR